MEALEDHEGRGGDRKDGDTTMQALRITFPRNLKCVSRPEGRRTEVEGRREAGMTTEALENCEACGSRSKAEDRGAKGRRKESRWRQWEEGLMKGGTGGGRNRENREARGSRGEAEDRGAGEEEEGGRRNHEGGRGKEARVKEALEEEGITSPSLVG